MSRIHEALRKAAREREPAGTAAATTAAAVGSVRVETSIAPLSAPAPTLKKDKGVPSKGLEASVTYAEFVERCAHPEWQIEFVRSIFHNPNTPKGVAERFRMLRSRLYEAAATRTLRKLLVTSGIAGEGKTFVAANLAQSIVQQPERRVLLIDADLRVPRLHGLFGAPRTPGLAEYLRGEANEFEVVQKGGEENLCLISAGAEVDKPSELLLSDRMKRLLDGLAPLFDWIIIDSPPTLPVHDASDLARLSDGVLLVLRAGAINRAAAEKATAEFKGKNLLGIVLNQVKQQDTKGEYYYYPKRPKTIPGA